MLLDGRLLCLVHVELIVHDYREEVIVRDYKEEVIVHDYEDLIVQEVPITKKLEELILHN